MKLKFVAFILLAASTLRATEMYTYTAPAFGPGIPPTLLTLSVPDFFTSNGVFFAGDAALSVEYPVGAITVTKVWITNPGTTFADWSVFYSDGYSDGSNFFNATFQQNGDFTNLGGFHLDISNAPEPRMVGPIVLAIAIAFLCLRPTRRVNRIANTPPCASERDG